jgi:hypothetical protein
MRTVVIFSLALCSLTSGAKNGCSSDTPEQPFFNGTDLSGWEGLLQQWSVKDGAIVGSTFPEGIKYNTFLCSKRKYKDFELSFQIRLRGGPTANSGVQIRSKIVETEHFTVQGPQADIGEAYWGSLYGERMGGMMKQAPADVWKRVLKEGEFNDYLIRCVGKHCTIKLNGATTVDDDFPTMPEEGIIAWQLHAGPAMEATFRNIRFRDLGSK